MNHPLWTHTVQDCISDGMETVDIVQLSRFQTIMSMGGSIESLEIVEVNLDIIEDDKVYPMLSVDIVANGETFHVTISINSEQMIHFVRCNYDGKAQVEVNRFFR